MLTDEWKCNRINYLSTGFQQTALNCTARCHQGLGFHTYNLEVNLNKPVKCVNWIVLQTPVQTQLLRTAAFLWLEISWGVTQAGWGVTDSSSAVTSLIQVLSLGCSRGKWSRSRLITFTNLSHSPQRGWKLCCQIFQFSDRAKRGRAGRSSSSRACQNVRNIEKFKNGCPLFLQVLGL